MRRIAVAGGIGAGKTVVTSRLVELGWPVVDADVIARGVTAKGTPAWRALRDAFGDAVLAPDEEIDRAFLADVVFHDSSALSRLNRITHGAIGVEMLRQLDAATGAAVFVAIPLYRAEHREQLSLDSVWAVKVSPTTALARLRAGRSMAESDARARLAAQTSNEELAGVVDRILVNEGSIDELYAQVDAALADEGLDRG